MLEAMRRHSESVLIYVIFGLLIVVFVINFGPGSGACSGPAANWAATVNGEIIRQQEFAVEYSRYADSVLGRLNGLPQEFIDARRNELRRQVLDRFVDRALLAHEANRQGIVVSDAELAEYLRANFSGDEFKLDALTRKEYEQWTNYYFGVGINRFEERVRDEIAADKLRRLITDNVSVSDAELKLAYEQEHDRVMLTYVKIDTADFEAPGPTQAEVQKLIAEEEQALKERFEADAFRYRTPHQVRARQIVKHLPADASEADVARVRGELLALKTQLDGGADFAALAKQHSDDAATKDNGGDMGFIKRGQLIKAVEDAVFTLKKDETTAEPVRSRLGLHLIRVEEIKAPERQELTAVQEEVAKSILLDRARESQALARAEALLTELRGGKPLDALTWNEEEAKGHEQDKAKKPVRADTPWILRTQTAIGRIGTSEELHQAAFALTPDKPLGAKPYKVGRSFYVVMLKERETPNMQTFAEQKEALREQAVSAKRSRVFQEWVASLREKATVELNPALFDDQAA